MTKWKYKTDGIGKNKKIKEQRRKPLPLSLMRNEKCDSKNVDLPTTKSNLSAMFAKQLKPNG